MGDGSSETAAKGWRGSNFWPLNAVSIQPLKIGRQTAPKLQLDDVLSRGPKATGSCFTTCIGAEMPTFRKENDTLDVNIHVLFQPNVNLDA